MKKNSVIWLTMAAIIIVTFFYILGILPNSVIYPQSLSSLSIFPHYKFISFSQNWTLFKLVKANLQISAFWNLIPFGILAYCFFSFFNYNKKRNDKLSVSFAIGSLLGFLISLIFGVLISAPLSLILFLLTAIYVSIAHEMDLFLTYIASYTLMMAIIGGFATCFIFSLITSMIIMAVILGISIPIIVIKWYVINKKRLIKLRKIRKRENYF